MGFPLRCPLSHYSRGLRLFISAQYPPSFFPSLPLPSPPPMNRMWEVELCKKFRRDGKLNNKKKQRTRRKEERTGEEQGNPITTHGQKKNKEDRKKKKKKKEVTRGQRGASFKFQGEGEGEGGVEREEREGGRARGELSAAFMRPLPPPPPSFQSTRDGGVRERGS